MNDMQWSQSVGGDLLIVDESLSERKVLEEMLKGSGYGVCCAETGQTALRFALEDPPDLILLSPRLAGMDGFEVCRRLKTEARTRDIPVIFIDALKDAKAKMKGIAEGGVDYITKPYHLEEVSRRVKTHLALYRFQHHLERVIQDRTAELAVVNQRLAMSNAGLETETEPKAQAEQTLKERLDFERLLSDISALFINLPDEAADAVIESALHLINEFFQVDRCGLVRISIKDNAWRVTHAAYAPGIASVPKNTDLPLSMFPWVAEKIIKMNDMVLFKTRDELPEEAAVDKQTYEEWEIRSAINIPVSVNGPYHYIITINAVSKECEWPQAYIPRVRLLGEYMAGMLQRQAARQQLEQQMKLTELLSRMSARFVNLPAENVDREIEDGLREFVRFFNIGRGILAQFSVGRKSAVVTHQWVQPNAPMPPSEIASGDIPWVIGQLMRGAPVIISDAADLPEDAEADREFLLGLGLRSVIYLPLTIASNCLGFLVLSDLRAPRVWSADVVDTLQLAANVLANALERVRSEKVLNQHLREIERLKQQIEQENLYLREEIQLKEAHQSIVCESKSMQRILAQVEQVARTDATVLIQGETGTGKELIARAIHQLSSRGKHPLVSVNCASLSPTLIESELFGREKGAYTGALTRMAGRFEIANNSTLFLDEIGELPFEAQSKLLRVLEQGQFERLGSTHTIHVNVRIIAATNRDLSKESTEGRFRKDLFYRLNVFPITIPPLRERPEDIAPMVWAFVRHYRSSLGKQIDHIPVKSMQALKRHPWPGNARELRNIVEHAMIISRGKALEVVLPQTDRIEMQAAVNLEEVERLHILKVLQRCGWRITGSHGAAAALGLKRTTLQSKMKKLGIIRPSS